MSDYTLRGLYIPDDNSNQVKQNQKIELKGLNLSRKKQEQVPQEEDKNSIGAFLDSLAITTVPTNNTSNVSIESVNDSDNENKKVSSSPKTLSKPKKQDLSILDQLMIPDDLITKTLPQSYSITSSKPKEKQKPVSEVLSGLQPTKVTQSSTQKQTTQFDLGDLNVSVTSRTSRTYTRAADGTKTISKTYSIGAVVAPNDITTDKLKTAIEKIKNWDKKVGALDSELKKQKNGEGSGADAIVTRSQQVARAKKDAIESRQQALEAYSDALDELKKAFGSTGPNTPKAEAYKTLYDEMEKKFAEVTEKDKTTWSQMMDYAQSAMSSEGFIKFKALLNPANAFR